MLKFSVNRRYLNVWNRTKIWVSKAPLKVFKVTTDVMPVLNVHRFKRQQRWHVIGEFFIGCMCTPSHSSICTWVWAFFTKKSHGYEQQNSIVGYPAGRLAPCSRNELVFRRGHSPFCNRDSASGDRKDDHSVPIYLCLLVLKWQVYSFFGVFKWNASFYCHSALLTV